MMKQAFAAAVLALSTAHIFAADLFQDGKLRPINSGDLIVATDTIGGYPIFQDDGRWKFASGKESASTGGVSAIKMGSALLDYYQGTYLLARQSLFASLDVGGQNNFWTGSPCSIGHLVIRNKGQGQQDNCMTIDPKIVNLGAIPTLFLTIVLTNTGSSGRYYQMSLYVNADLLGVRSTGLGDWTKEELKAKPYKQEALSRLTAWAEPLQDASIRALDFSKPQDVYAKIPSLMTLLPVPEDLAGKKYDISFLSAVEHLRHQPAFKSIAYSRVGDDKTGWSFLSGQTTQEIADTATLRRCETYRMANKPDGSPCEVYRLEDGKRVSTTDGPKTSPASPENQKNDLPQKLEKLKDLFAKGLINKEQYDAQVKDALSKM